MRINSIELLAPSMRAKIMRLMSKLDKDRWTIFETYRTPEDQFKMLLKGVSKARPMLSAHQHGLAVDVIPLRNGKPYWPPVGDERWTELTNAVALVEGLSVPILWDPGHVEDTNFAAFQDILE